MPTALFSSKLIRPALRMAVVSTVFAMVGSVIVYRLRLLSADAPRSVDELLNRNITVTALAIKMATLRRRIFHAEGAKISFKSGQTYIYKNVLERVRPRFPGVIDCNIVSAVSLVDIDIALEPE
jgi:hypothetical protein